MIEHDNMRNSEHDASHNDYHSQTVNVSHARTDNDAMNGDAISNDRMRSHDVVNHDLRVYNSMTRRKEPFVSKDGSHAGMYVCGPTVQSAPHIGHMRSMVVFDVIRKWLGISGYDTHYVMNITDIDDKILVKASEKGMDWRELAYMNEREFISEMNNLRITPPDVLPHATGNIHEIIMFIQRLINTGHAYILLKNDARIDNHGVRDSDGSDSHAFKEDDSHEVANSNAKNEADSNDAAINVSMIDGVYFNVMSWPDYGKLTNQHVIASKRPTDVHMGILSGSMIKPAYDPFTGVSGHDSKTVVNVSNDEAGNNVVMYAYDKLNEADFALWKASKPSDPVTARFASPWGHGRPGWHIECSVMSHKHLNEYDPSHSSNHVDIHDGHSDSNENGSINVNHDDSHVPVDIFDIHGGGLDLRFPHHENEIAQTEAAGYDTAHYWLHSYWVTMKGEKMSKSLGNGLSMRSLYEKYESYYAIRFMLTSVNYRSMLEYDDGIMQSSLAFKSKLTRVMKQTLGILSDDENPTHDLHVNENIQVEYDDLPFPFKEALNDDFNVSLALSVIHQHLNTLIGMIGFNHEDSSADNHHDDNNEHHGSSFIDSIYSEYLTIRGMLSVLGLDLLSHDWFTEYAAVNSNHADNAMTGNTDGIMRGEADSAGFISALNEIRRVMRVNHDYNYADMLRDVMNQYGYQVNDGRV